MALPNSTNLLGMDYEFNGQPFVSVPTVSTVNTLTMDYEFNGQPFVVNPTLNGPSNIGGWDGVTATNINSLYGVPYINIETITGVT